MATVHPQTTRYSQVAIWLHWIIALAIILNITAALVSEGMTPADRATVMANHKSIGLTILILSLARLAWGMSHPAPALNPDLKAWERSTARLVHRLFYVLMIGVPLLGWIMVSGGDRPLAWFGVPFPKLPVLKGGALAEFAHQGHGLLGFSFIGLFVLHVGGALKHQFIDRDRELARMNPFARDR